MTWARFDDDFHSHPKVLAAGDAAVGLFVRMVCYSNRYLTDGVIDKTVARNLCPDLRQLKRKIATLLKVDLLKQIGNEYVIHDFHEYNPKAAEVKAKRDKDNARKKGNSGDIPHGFRAESDAPDPPPVPVPNIERDPATDLGESDLSRQLTSAELQQIGAKYGQLGGVAQVAILRLLPIYRHEIDAALATPGRSWKYAATVIEGVRDEMAKGQAPAGSPNPTRSGPMGFGEITRQLMEKAREEDEATARANELAGIYDGDDEAPGALPGASE